MPEARWIDRGPGDLFRGINGYFRQKKTGGQIETQNGKYIDRARRKKELFLSLIK
jgi:hypothetical protein